LERLLDEIVADGVPPRRVPQTPVLIERLVDNVPPVHTPFVAADDGRDVIVQPAEQGCAIDRGTTGAGKHPSRRLLVPQEDMPDDEHAVTASELYVAIGGLEVVPVLGRMNLLPLQHVLWAHRVELCRHDCKAGRIAAIAQRLTQCDADLEAGWCQVFESGRRIGAYYRGRRVHGSE